MPVGSYTEAEMGQQASIPDTDKLITHSIQVATGLIITYSHILLAICGAELLRLAPNDII